MHVDLTVKRGELTLSFNTPFVMPISNRFLRFIAHCIAYLQSALQ